MKHTVENIYGKQFLSLGITDILGWIILLWEAVLCVLASLASNH